jgi:hypothetical protein
MRLGRARVSERASTLGGHGSSVGVLGAPCVRGKVAAGDTHRIAAARRDLNYTSGAVRVVLHCWAHVRRKLIEAEPFFADAKQGVELIGELYEIEKLCPTGHPATSFAAGSGTSDHATSCDASRGGRVPRARRRATAVRASRRRAPLRARERCGRVLGGLVAPACLAPGAVTMRVACQRSSASTCPGETPQQRNRPGMVVLT